MKLVHFLIFTGFSLFSSAQVNTYIGAYSGVNKDGYLQPIANVLTSSFNTGIVQYSRIDSGFYFYFGIIGSASLVLSENLKFFDAVTPENFIPNAIVSAPTLLGPRNSVNYQGINGTVYTFPAGIGLKFLSLAVPQISIGNLAGTEFTGRFFAYDTKDDVGKINYLAIGARHDLSQYFFKNKNADLSISYTYQKASTGTYLDFHSHLAKAIMGRSGKRWNYFAFVGYQKSKIKGTYKSTDEKEEIVHYDLDNKNNLITGISGGISLGKLHMQGIASGLSPVVLSASLGLKL